MRRTQPRTRRRATRTSRAGYRIGLLLLTLAVVPLTGAAWFAVSDVRAATATSAEAASVDASVSRLVLLTELRAVLIDERNWFTALAGMRSIGVDNDAVVALTGIDIPSELATARQRVDELVAQLGLDNEIGPLAAARSQEVTNLTLASRPYQRIEADVSAESQQTLDDLLHVAGHLEGGEELITTLQTLQASTVARQAITDEFTAYFGAQFEPNGGTQTSSRRATDVPSGSRPALGAAESLAPVYGGAVTLVGQRAVRVQAEYDLDRIAAPDSRAQEALSRILASPAAHDFDKGSRALIDQLLSTSGSGTGSPSAGSVDLDGLAGTFMASSTTLALYLDLVEAAGTDALRASASLGVSAHNQLIRAIWSMSTLAAVSLLFAAATTRAIDRPIRHLADVARRISDGDSGARFGQAGGPSEIRAAGRAMDAAAAHLEVAEHQAKALADGDLTNPILSRPSTGELGASLQHAVEALASSMQEREEFRRRMTHEATHDGLTQIPNRNASLSQLRRGLARVQRSETLLAVLFIDLDGFKEVNDRHGHHVGDHLLRGTAQRLVNTVRDGDHVGRLGGDEFLVIAEPVTGIDEAVQLAERLLTALNEPMEIESTIVSVGASIGIALSDGNDAESTDLLRDADLAVYKAKADGRGRIELCDDDLRSAMYERTALEEGLRRAIVDHEFILYYQPIVEPITGALRGYEALIRWNRPGHGMISPDSFIPIAERSDLIVAIDRWVLGAAVRQLRMWDDQGIEIDVPLSVNISGRHLGSASLVDDVLSPLIDHGVDPTRLIVEITESALLDDLEDAAAKLQILRHHGVRVAIDDFGTGYTSLAHLKSLPIDILKIDRSYVNDESASSLVQLIIDTGHLLGARITAEGIETEGQASLLAQMGSDDLQGYYYGRPLPAGDVTGRLASPTDSTTT